MILHTDVLCGDPILEAKFGNLIRTLISEYNDEFVIPYLLTVLDPACEDVKELFAHLCRRIVTPTYIANNSISELHAIFMKLGYLIDIIDARNITVHEGHRGYPVCSVKSRLTGESVIKVRRPIRGITYRKGVYSKWFMVVPDHLRTQTCQATYG